MKRFVLFFAGEDSGDILGEDAVYAARLNGFEAHGVGGYRMERSGLLKIFDYEKFPVSGFFDVLFRVLFFKRVLKTMRKELLKKECIAFCAIDYPGMNMALCKMAKKIKKPVLYLAPPQVFAWKSSRAKQLNGVSLYVFFPFERLAYEKLGVKVQMLQHPFLKDLKEIQTKKLKSNRVLLLPGSRESVLKRNLPLYKLLADNLKALGFKPVFIVSRFTLLEVALHGLKNQYDVQMARENATERAKDFFKSYAVISVPGTSVFEAIASKTFAITLMRPDALTYVLCKCLLHVKHLSIPNLLLNKRMFPEIIATPIHSNSYVVKCVLEKLFNRMPVENSIQKEFDALRMQKTIGEASSLFFKSLEI